MPVLGTIYLLHFNRPFKHVKHYLGWAEDHRWLDRIEQHRRGGGAKFFKNIQLHGADISFRLARTWESKDRYYERKLKGSGKSKLCPICKQEALSQKGNGDENSTSTQNSGNSNDGRL